MPKKLHRLRKLIINEISLVTAGANPGAYIKLIKRDAPAEIETPRDSDRNFGATGRGPAHEKLLIAYDNYKRQMGPAQSSRAFELAWADLTDDEKQEIRDEEAATEGARQAQADGEQKQREREMNKIDEPALLLKAAHEIAAGTIENVVCKSTWYAAIRAQAEARQAVGQTVHQAFAKFVTEDPDGRAMFAAHKSAPGDDATVAAAPPSAPVLKSDSAYARLHDIGAGLMAADPSLTRHAAFAKAYAANPELAARAKNESAFA
jgi:hypothetical protein